MADPFADIFEDATPQPAAEPLPPPDPFADLFSPAPVVAAPADSVPVAGTSPVVGDTSDPFGDIFAEQTPAVVDPLQPVVMPNEAQDVSFWESFKRGTTTVEAAFGGFIDTIGEKVKARNSATSVGMLGALFADQFIPGADIEDAVLGFEDLGETFNSGATQIRKHAAKRAENYDPHVQLLGEGETFWDALGDDRRLDYIVQAGGENLPMLVGGALVGGSAALSAKLAGMGKAAMAQFIGASTFGYTWGLESGLSYDDLLKKGATPTEAADTALQVGMVNGMLESLPILELFKNAGITNKVRKELSDEMMKTLSSNPQLRDQLWNILKIAGMEGATEGLQEFVANVGKRVYDEHQNLFEGVDESIFIGTLLGGGVSTTVEAAVETGYWAQKAKEQWGPKTTPLSLPTLQQELEAAIEAHEIQLQKLDEAADATLEGGNLSKESSLVEPTFKRDQQGLEARDPVLFEGAFNSMQVQTRDGWKPLKEVPEPERRGKAYVGPYGNEQRTRLLEIEAELVKARELLEASYDGVLDVQQAQESYNKIQELEAEKKVNEKTLLQLPDVMDGLRRTLQNYIKDMLPEYTAVLQTGKRSSSGAVLVDTGRKVMRITFDPYSTARDVTQSKLTNPDGSFNLSRILATANHEFGHALFHHYYQKAPLKVQAALEQEYLNFLTKLQRTPPEQMAQLIDAPGAYLKNIYEAFNLLPRREGSNLKFENMIGEVSPEQLRILREAFTFDEWFAQQVTKHKAVKPTGASKLFNKVRAALKRFMRLHPEGFRPEATVDEWLGSLSTGVTMETAKRRVEALTPQNVTALDANTLTQDNENVSTEVYDEVFGPPGVMTPTGAWTGDYLPAKEMDEYRTDMSRFKRWALTLVQAQRRNPHLEPVERFVDLASEYEKINREYHTRVDENLRRWRHLGKKQGAALSEFALEANRISYEKGRRLTDLELATLAEEMSGEQMTQETFDFYKELQTEFDNNLTVMQDAIENQLQRTMDLTTDQGIEAFDEVVEKLRRQVTQAKKRNYFPTSRFGDYTVTVRARGDQSFLNKDYSDEQVVVFETYPTKKLAQRRKAQLKKQFKETDYAVSDGKLTKYERDYVGLPLPLLQSMRELVPEDKRQELDKAIARSLPGQGFAKRFAGFHGVLGASKDGARSYANYTASFGRYLAKVQLADQMDKAISDLEGTIRSVEMNEGDVAARKELIAMMQHQREYIINPKYEWQWLSALAFNYHLAFVPSKVVLNLMQVPTVVMPYMNEKYGEKAAFKHMNKAIKQAYDIHKHPERYPDHVHAALERLAAEGVTTQSMFHEMAGLESTGPLADRIPPGNTKERATALLRGMSVIGSWMWTHSENAIRTITALAMYNAEIEAGASPEAAYHATKNGIRDGMFEYSRWNRPRFMQGNLRAITIFMTHIQHMLEHIIGPYKSKWQVLGMLLLIGGLQGLPFMEDFQEILTFLFRQMNDMLGREVFPHDARLAFRKEVQNIVTELTDDPQSMWTDAILRGGSRYSLGLAEAGRLAYDGLEWVGMPDEYIDGLQNIPEFDMHSSLTLGRVAPGLDAINAPDMNSFVSRATQGIAGAGLSIPLNIIKAGYDTNATDMARLRGMSPAFLRYPLTALEYSMNEAAQDAKGNHLVRFDKENELHQREVMMQSLGFNVSRVNVAKEANWAYKSTRMYYQRRRAEFYRLYAEAIMEGDTRGIQEIVSRVHRFNKDAPVWARVDSGDFKAGVENRLLSKARAKAGLPTGAGVRDVEIKRAIDEMFPQREGQ